VVAGGKLLFWGDGQQTYLDHGQDPIREDTTEVLPMSNYDFDGSAAPKPIGLASMMFGTGVGSWSSVTEVFFRNGRADGEIVITAHVPKYIPAKLRHIVTGQSAGKAFFLSDSDPNSVYLYQWYNQGSERVQSAWNKWTFPCVEKVLWATIHGNEVWFAFQYTTKFTLESVRMERTGDEVVDGYTLRLDHRVDETKGSWSSGTWTVTLPYTVPTDKRPLFGVYDRTTDAEADGLRGRKRTITWTGSDTFTFAGDEDLEFYFGAIPVSIREANRFYAKDKNDQVVLHDKLTIKRVVFSHNQTASYKVVVGNAVGESFEETFSGRVLGDPTVVNNKVPVKTGTFGVRVNAETEDATITLVNDTPFPAVWTAMRYVYELTLLEQ